MSLNLVARAVALVVMVASAGQAQAANTDLSLLGIVSDGSFSNQTIGNTRFDQWLLNLIGLDANSAFSVSQGDSITATITLDESLTVPASVSFTSLALVLRGTGFAGDSVETSGTVSLSNLGVPVITTSHGASTSGQVAAGFGISPPNNGAITFDRMVWTVSIDTLSQQANLDDALIQYTLFSPAVPEPATYALMLLGVGGLAGLARRRQARGG